MVIITYRSTALSESDFLICNAIRVKTGMQKKNEDKFQPQFYHKYYKALFRGRFSIPSGVASLKEGSRI